MGKASRVKQQRKERAQQPPDRATGSSARKGRALLVMLTNEPFQPIRLSWAIPSRDAVQKELVHLDCIDIEEAEPACWVWLFHGESAVLPIGDGYKAVPVERRPLVLGRIRFPRESLMTFDTNSTSRAVEAARFFSRRTGSGCTLIRARVVNRLFSAEEGQKAGIQELMKTLDQNVSVRDPREAEGRLSRDLQGAHGQEAVERVLAARQRRIMQTGGDDVPLVEDFPLTPEEETPDFMDLNIALQLRLVRAMQHWRGNSLTLSQLIIGMVTGELDVPGSGPLRDAMMRSVARVLG